MNRRPLAILLLICLLIAPVFSACNKAEPDKTIKEAPTEAQTEKPGDKEPDSKQPELEIPGIISPEAIDPPFEEKLPDPEEKAPSEQDIFEFSTLFHGMRSVSGSKIILQDSRTVEITGQEGGYLFSVDDGSSHIASFVESELRLPAVALMREGTLVAGSMILPAGDNVAQDIGEFFAKGGKVIAWDAFDNQMAAAISRMREDFREVCELYLFRADGSKILLYSCPMVRYGEEEGLYSVAFDKNGNLYFYDPGSENPMSGWEGRTLVFETAKLPGDSYYIDYVGRPRPMADRRYIGLTRNLSGDIEEIVYDTEIKDLAIMAVCDEVYAADGQVLLEGEIRNEVFSIEKGYETDRLPAESLLSATFVADSALMLKFDDSGFAVRRFELNGSFRRNTWSYPTGTDSAKLRFLSGMVWMDDNRLLYWSEGMESDTYSYKMTLAEPGGSQREVITLEADAKAEISEHIIRIIPLRSGLAVITSARIIYYDGNFGRREEIELPLATDFYGNRVPWQITDITADGSRLLYVNNGSLYLSGADFSNPELLYESSWDLADAMGMGSIVATGEAYFSDDEKTVAFTVAGYEYIAGTGVYDIAKKELTFHEGEAGFKWLKGDSQNLYLIEGREGEGGLTPSVLNIATGEKTDYSDQWLGTIRWLDNDKTLKYSYGLETAVISVTDAKTGRENMFIEPFHAAAFPVGVIPSPNGKYIAFYNEYFGRASNIVIIRLEK